MILFFFLIALSNYWHQVITRESQIISLQQFPYFVFQTVLHLGVYTV